MENLLVRVKTRSNLKLNDDEFVDECMSLLTDKYPQITDWVWERLDDQHIQIMMWGQDMRVSPE